MTLPLKSVAAGMLSVVLVGGSLLATGTDVSAENRRSAKCSDCGTVIAINRRDQKTEGSQTTGTVIGGVGGAVAGKMIGDSNTAAVVGGLGGAALGNMIGKNMGKKKIWSVQVKLETGKVIGIDYETEPDLRQGDRVRLVDGRLQRM